MEQKIQKEFNGQTGSSCIDSIMMLYEGGSEHYQSCCWDWEWQVVPLSAISFIIIVIIGVSLINFAATALCGASQ